MDTAKYIDKITTLFGRVMLGPLDFKLPLEAGDIELSTSQFRGLVFLQSHEHTSIGELAEGLGISHPAAVKMVSRLKQRRLVEREEAKHDRRISHIRLTELGRDVVGKIQERRLQILKAATQQMKHKELESLLIGLEALLSAAMNSQSTIEQTCLRCGTNHIGCCPVNRAHSVLMGTGITKT